MMINNNNNNNNNGRSMTMRMPRSVVKIACMAAVVAAIGMMALVIFDDTMTPKSILDPEEDRRKHRQQQELIFTFDPSLFPNASGQFNRTFGIGGQLQPDRPMPPLSNKGGIFTGAGGFGSFAFNSTPINKLLAGDFGIDFPVPLNLPPPPPPPPATTKAPTKRPTKSPTRLPTRQPTKAPTKSPTRSPSRSPTQSPITQSPIPPMKFYAQSLNTDPATNGTLSALPFKVANDKRAEFLGNFVVGQLESFESYAPVGSGTTVTTFAATAITSVGTVTFNGDLEAVRNGTASFNGFRFATDGSKWLRADLSTGLEIVFAQTVVGAGFVIVDLDNASNGPSPISVQFFNGVTPVDTIDLTPFTQGNPGNVVFIGYINRLGFTRIVLPTFNDRIAIDMLNAYVASQLAT
jgi:hypothetical protein